MESYVTKVTICRRSDRKIRTIYVDESGYAIREKYIKAALGNRQLKLGECLIDLDESLVLSIDQVFMRRSLSMGNPNPFGPMKTIRRMIGRKHPSSAGH